MEKLKSELWKTDKCDIKVRKKERRKKIIWRKECKKSGRKWFIKRNWKVKKIKKSEKWKNKKKNK